jgi:hypothetical protein
MKTVKTTWKLLNYDVWGNKDDGFEVNQSYTMCRSYPINLKIEDNNPGTNMQFFSAYPSDYQIKKAFGVSCKLDLSGDDLSIYVNRESDGYPIGEMFCTSHESLSPIREVKEKV